MIITVTLNPAVDKTAVLHEIHVHGLNRLTKVTRDAGGKGINVSKTIRELGGASIAMGFIAGSTGQFIKDELDQLNIANCMLPCSGMTRENLKIVDEKGNLTEFNESGPILSTKDINVLTRKIIEMSKPNDIVVLSGSMPPSLPKDTYGSMVRDCKIHGLHVFVDAEGDALAHALQEGPALIKPNTYELAKYFGVSEDMSEHDMIQYARKLVATGCNQVVVSRGHEGALFVNSTQVFKTKGIAVEVKSTVGAGDAMVGAMAYALHARLPMMETIRLAVAASAGAVMSEGTKPADRSLVNALMRQVDIEQLEVVK